MKKFITIFLSFIMLFCLSLESFAEKMYDIDSIISDTANYIFKTVSEPQVGAIGGEWAVIGLARSSEEIPEEYFENYYKTVCEYTKGKKGILHNKKYTEYSRVILALTAIDKTPKDVAGYNLLTPLGDYEKTIWQGVNGSIWALIALDSANYEIPQNKEAKTQATRQMYINNILENQTPDGGWALSGNTADADITAMALQALSRYQDDERVKSAIDKALLCVADLQNEDGGFTSYATESSESCAQMIVALCELGIDISDERFVKNEKTLLDNILTYYTPENGFVHTYENNSNQMATEQVFYSLVALQRKAQGKSGLYDMSDIKITDNTTEESASGLKGKNPDVKKMEILYPERTFFDVLHHTNKTAVEELAKRNIINGKTENTFEPDSTMTRAEFATIIARGLGLTIKSGAVFSDVSKSDWFFDYVNTAYSYGIIKGVSETEFNPYGTITREEAAVMVKRAASLCGLDTEIYETGVRDILAGFSDYVKASDWARASLAFCYDAGVLDDDALEIKPKESVTRAEISQMLYNMLFSALLI